MPVRELLTTPCSMLGKPCAEVSRFDGKLRAFARDLIDTMHHHGAVGIAANQIGRGLRVFAANSSRDTGNDIIVVNPRITNPRGTASLVEGCLSIPETWGKVKRAAEVTLIGQDLSGNEITLKADGLLAVIFQHEVDHLNGRLFIDRLAWFKRHSVQRRLRKQALKRNKDRA